MHSAVVWLALAGLAAAASHTRAPALVDYVVAGDAVPLPLAGLAGDAERGRTIVLDRRRGNCLICHAFPLDEPFQGEIGPALSGIGSRLGAGQLRLRLIDQSRLNPDTLMPPYYRAAGLTDVAPEFADRPALDAQQVEDVVAYLVTLTDP